MNWILKFIVFVILILIINIINIIFFLSNMLSTHESYIYQSIFVFNSLDPSPIFPLTLLFKEWLILAVLR